MLGESIHHCFFRLKRPSSSTPPSSIDSRHAPAAAAAAVTSATASSSSSSDVVFKNFNSLYDPTSDTETPNGSASQTLTLSSSAAADSSSDSPGDGSPDLSVAIASRRFFAAAPGRSNSIVDSAAVAFGGAGLAVPTYSPDPYWDFRRSMEEMMAALGLDPRSHRADLHELLLCYLALNRKHAHKYIVGAFADLLAAAAESRPEAQDSGLL